MAYDDPRAALIEGMKRTEAIVSDWSTRKLLREQELADMATTRKQKVEDDMAAFGRAKELQKDFSGIRSKEEKERMRYADFLTQTKGHPKAFKAGIDGNWQEIIKEEEQEKSRLQAKSVLARMGAGEEKVEKAMLDYMNVARKKLTPETMRDRLEVVLAGPSGKLFSADDLKVFKNKLNNAKTGDGVRAAVEEVTERIANYWFTSKKTANTFLTAFEKAIEPDIVSLGEEKAAEILIRMQQYKDSVNDLNLVVNAATVLPLPDLPKEMQDQILLKIGPSPKPTKEDQATPPPDPRESAAGKAAAAAAAAAAKPRLSIEDIVQNNQPQPTARRDASGRMVIVPGQKRIPAEMIDYMKTLGQVQQPLGLTQAEMESAMSARRPQAAPEATPEEADAARALFDEKYPGIRTEASEAEFNKKIASGDPSAIETLTGLIQEVRRRSLGYTNDAASFAR